MDKEIFTMMEESRKHDEARRLRLREKIRNEFPGLDIEGLKEGGSLRGDYEVYLNNREYIVCDGVVVVKLPSSLQYSLGFLEKYNTAYEILNVGPKLYVVEKFLSDEVAISEYYSTTGHVIKGVRRHRKLHKSSKGHYIEIKGKRHYVSFLNNK